MKRSECDTNRDGLDHIHTLGTSGYRGVNSITHCPLHYVHSIMRAHSISESDQGCVIVTMLRRVNVHEFHEFQDEPEEAIERP